MFPNLGFGELLIILVLFLLLFGAKRLPEVAQGIGKAIRTFKQGMNDVKADIENTDEKPTKKDA